MMDLRKPGAVRMVTAMLVIILTSCSVLDGSQRKNEQQSRNDAAVTAIHAMLAKTPGVLKVDAGYSNYITNPGTVQISLIVRGGTDLEHIADLAVGAAWRSQLDPLKSINVGAVEDEDRTKGIERSYSIFDNKTELEAKYGPRPVELR